MKVREKENPEVVFFSCLFNVHAYGEILGYDETFGCDLFYIEDLEVLLENSTCNMMNGVWKDMRQAFKDHDLITDNHNTRFFEPANEEDRKRGFTI